jgi:hypothetical protein
VQLSEEDSIKRLYESGLNAILRQETMDEIDEYWTDIRHAIIQIVTKVLGEPFRRRKN